jgi:hypothetical protein
MKTMSPEKDVSVGGPILQAPVSRSLQTELDNRANVSFDDPGERRIVLSLVVAWLGTIRLATQAG